MSPPYPSPKPFSSASESSALSNFTAVPTPSAMSTSSSNVTSPSPTFTATPPPQNQTFTLVDDRGDMVVVNAPVKRIVCLANGMTEIIYALGCGDLVVGRDIGSTFPPSVLGVPVVADVSSNLNMELLLELKPDLVVADTRHSTEIVQKIRDYGITVVIDSPSKSERVKTIIQNFGLILNKSIKATELVAYMEYYENLVKERIANLTQSDKPLVYYEWVKPWYSCSNGSLPNQMLLDAGGRNLADGSSVLYPTLSAEYVVEKNPDVIVRILAQYDGNTTAFENMRSEIINRTGLSSVKAVQNGRVYVMDGLFRTGIRQPIGLICLAKWFHPAFFSDINVGVVHEELIQKFFGLTIEGTYAYPEIVTVTDVKGVTLTIPLPVNRIVAITSGVTDILFSLGAGDKLVGRDSYSTFPVEILKVPVVAGSSASPNIELIAGLEPDLVIADSMLSSDNRAKIEMLLGIPVIVENPSDSDRVTPLVKYIGAIVDKEKTAEKIVNFMNNITTLVKERLQNLTDNNKPLVYYEWNKAWFSCNKQSLPHQMITSAGGLNIAADQNVTYPTLSPEYIIERNPDIIIRMISSANHNITDFQSMHQELVSRPALRATQAVQNGKVYVLDSYFRTGTRNPLGLLTLAKWFHPDLFADVDPTAIHREMIQTFFGVTLEGTYAYP